MKTRMMRAKQSLIGSFSLVAGLAAGLLGPAGCRDTTEVGSTDGPQTCEEAQCELEVDHQTVSATRYICYCGVVTPPFGTIHYTEQQDKICALDQDDADDECDYRCASHNPKTTPVPCDNDTEDGPDSTSTSTGIPPTTTTWGTTEEPTTGDYEDCAFWDPDAEVDFVAGVHYVDGGFFFDTAEHPMRLVLCDAARFDPLPGGGFELQWAFDGGLFYELGLRSGDIPLELNGLPLDDFQDAADAYLELYLNEANDEFSLEVLRGSTTVVLEYTLIVTL